MYMLLEYLILCQEVYGILFFFFPTVKGFATYVWDPEMTH